MIQRVVTARIASLNRASDIYERISETVVTLCLRVLIRNLNHVLSFYIKFSVALKCSYLIVDLPSELAGCWLKSRFSISLFSLFSTPAARSLVMLSFGATSSRLVSSLGEG